MSGLQINLLEEVEVDVNRSGFRGRSKSTDQGHLVRSESQQCLPSSFLPHTLRECKLPLKLNLPEEQQNLYGNQQMMVQLLSFQKYHQYMPDGSPKPDKYKGRQSRVYPFSLY